MILRSVSKALIRLIHAAAMPIVMWAAISSLGAQSATAQQVPTGCVGGSGLNGWYGILVSANSNGGRYLAGAVDFNGACSVSGTNLTGGVGGQVSTSSVTGTYGQNSDGTYTLTLNLSGQSSPLTFTIGVAASGTKAVGIESDGSSVSNIDLESQLTSLTNGYNTASLNSTYAVSCMGGSRVGLDFVTFDGKGDLSGVKYYDLGGSQGSSSYAGTYSMNSDGTFSGGLSGSYSSYSFAGVVDNGVTEIQYVYDQSGSGDVEACSGRQAPAAVLNGYYGMLIGGTASNGQGGQEEFSGSAYFNSNGSFSVTNLQGGINAQYGDTTATGTYVSNGDGTLTLNMTLANQTTPQTFVVAVTEAGNEAVGIETDGAAEATIDLQSQLVTNGQTYNTASLNGTFAARCWGAEVDLNYVTFDGAGNQNGVDPYDNGNYGAEPYTGTYAVNTDGTFSGGFGGAYTLYTMTGVIDNATSEIEYTYDYTDGSVVSCAGYSMYGPVGTNPPAAAPGFSPAPGAYGSPQTVTLTTTTPKATIYYTVNGVTPTTSSLVYSQPFTITPPTTVEAIAVSAGYNNSPIAAATYFSGGTAQTASTPTFNPAPGSYNSSQTVTLSDSTPGAVIHCTTNGTTPTASSPVCTTVTVSASLTLEAIAVANGFNNSPVASGVYSITLTAAMPTFNPVPGTYQTTVTVTLSDSTPGAVMHCTLNGITPTPNSPVCTTATITKTKTLKAIAVASGYNTSPVTSGLYTITPPPAATPVFSPGPGTYTFPQTVVLADSTPNAVIHYTSDGSAPTKNSPVYRKPLDVKKTAIIQAMAVARGYGNSQVSGGSYVIGGIVKGRHSDSSSQNPAEQQ